jgi:hypothetical protein
MAVLAVLLLIEALQCFFYSVVFECTVSLSDQRTVEGYEVAVLEGFLTFAGGSEYCSTQVDRIELHNSEERACSPSLYASDVITSLTPPFLGLRTTTRT